MQQQPQPTQGQATQQQGAMAGQPIQQQGSTGEVAGGQGIQQPPMGQIGGSMQSTMQPTQQGSQQFGQGSQQFGQGGQQGGMGLALQDVETPDQRAAVDSVSRAIQVCGWCADQCIQAADPNMIECIRLCHDVAELGETVLSLLPRNSRYSQQILRAFEQAAQACAQECGQHNHAHCQECAQVLPGAAQAVQQFQASLRQQGQQPQQQF